MRRDLRISSSVELGIIGSEGQGHRMCQVNICLLKLLAGVEFLFSRIWQILENKRGNDRIIEKKKL